MLLFTMFAYTDTREGVFIMGKKEDRRRRRIGARKELIAEPRTKFGLFLRTWRLKRRYTLRELAARVGLSFSYIYEMETGTRRPPDDLWLPYLAEALNIDLREVKNAACSEIERVILECAPERPIEIRRLAHALAENWNELTPDLAAAIECDLRDWRAEQRLGRDLDSLREKKNPIMDRDRDDEKLDSVIA